MTASTRSYVPAAGHDWLLPFYDPIQWLMGGPRFRAAMIDAAGLVPGMRALDVGCGTGSLIVEIAKAHPEVEVIGLDPDPLALGRAQKKLDPHGLRATLHEGFADALPYDDASIDRVFSSFMFHHLEREVKQGMLREVHRVLAPGGALHLADFGGEAHAHGFLANLLHRHDDLHDNYGGGIPAMLREAGFDDVRMVTTDRTLFGRVTHYEAR